MAGLCEGGNEPPGSLKAKTEGRSRKRARAKCSRKTQSQSGEGDIQQRNNMSTEMNITPSTSAQTEPVEEEIQEIDSIPPAKMKVEPSTSAQAVSLEREIQEINNMSPAEVEVKPSTSAQAESLERGKKQHASAEVNVEPSTSSQAVSVERAVAGSQYRVAQGMFRLRDNSRNVGACSDEPTTAAVTLFSFFMLYLELRWMKLVFETLTWLEGAHGN
ncbi:hypothetical protein ANN_03452 [Periplaneta americana]|uniref:Uncharacterized protein n=1 Tax=Periplaneta americana TaxID=6978 RepID=A0ABQ8U207_PERAM|nr:hypothetical protein ANN_03452 [Periplaneta americana]